MALRHRSQGRLLVRDAEISRRYVALEDRRLRRRCSLPDERSRDVAQEAWVQLFEKMGGRLPPYPDRRGSYASYLLRIGINLVREKARRGEDSAPLSDADAIADRAVLDLDPEDESFEALREALGESAWPTFDRYRRSRASSTRLSSGSSDPPSSPAPSAACSSDAGGTA